MQHLLLHLGHENVCDQHSSDQFSLNFPISGNLSLIKLLPCYTFTDSYLFNPFPPGLREVITVFQNFFLVFQGFKMVKNPRKYLQSSKGVQLCQNLGKQIYKSCSPLTESMQTNSSVLGAIGRSGRHWVNLEVNGRWAQPNMVTGAARNKSVYLSKLHCRRGRKKVPKRK